MRSVPLRGSPWSARFKTMFMHYVGDCMMVGCDPDLLRAAQGCLFRNLYHHRLAGNRQQRLAGRRVEACGGITTWKLSSKRFDFFRGELARFVGKHYWNAVLNFIGQPVCLADQFLCCLLIDHGDLHSGQTRISSSLESIGVIFRRMCSIRVGSILASTRNTQYEHQRMQCILPHLFRQ